MRDDLPTPIRRDLDAERKQFCRAVGAAYEALVEAHIDPTPYMAEVLRLLHEATNDTHAEAA